MIRDDLDRFNRELLGAVLGEHCHHHIANDVKLGLIRRRNINKDIGCLQRDLGVISVLGASALRVDVTTSRLRGLTIMGGIEQTTLFAS